MTSNDQTHPYMIPRSYMEIASARLLADRGLLAPSYRRLLEKQIEDCRKKLEKKGGTSNHFPKSQE